VLREKGERRERSLTQRHEAAKREKRGGEKKVRERWMCREEPSNKFAARIGKSLRD
jgi:hypothetical protein